MKGTHSAACKGMQRVPRRTLTRGFSHKSFLVPARLVALAQWLGVGGVGGRARGARRVRVLDGLGDAPPGDGGVGDGGVAVRTSACIVAGGGLGLARAATVALGHPVMSHGPARGEYGENGEYAAARKAKAHGQAKAH